MKHDCKASHDCKGMKSKEHKEKEKMREKRRELMRQGKDRVPTAAHKEKGKKK